MKNPAPTEVPAARLPSRRQWLPPLLIAAGVGLVVHFLFFFQVPIPEGPPPQDVRPAPFAQFTGGSSDSDGLLEEQSMLMDSRPLFVPTRWNVASSLQGIARLRDEAELFSQYPPAIRLHADGWSPNDRSRGTVAFSVEDRLRENRQLHPLRGFGRILASSDFPTLEPRLGSVAVENLGGGSAPAAFPLPTLLEASPPTRLWNPVVFLIEVDPRSTGAPPLHVSGSGVWEWDLALARYVASSAFRRDLQPGYYRVTIGP